MAQIPQPPAAPAPAPAPAGPATPLADLLDQRTLDARTILVFGQVTEAVAADVVRRLIALDAAGDAPIDMIVCSPGGHVEAGDAIHDAVGFVRPAVTMIGTGWVGSAATHLYLAVPRERRVCLPNTRFLIHQPSSGFAGQASDIAIQARELVRTRERIAAHIARATGQPLAKVLEDIDRDRWMTAEEAIGYGLVSRIVRRRDELR